MGKKSRKKLRKQERLEKARFFNQQSTSPLLNVGLANLPADGLIPNSAAENPDAVEPSENFITIHFFPLCLQHQQIDRIQKPEARALVHKLFCVNTISRNEAARQGLIRDKIANDSSYSFLYKKAPPDAEILEVKFHEEGRIFGFFVQDTFNVLAIRTNHL